MLVLVAGWVFGVCILGSRRIRSLPFDEAAGHWCRAMPTKVSILGLFILMAPQGVTQDDPDLSSLPPLRIGVAQAGNLTGSDSQITTDRLELNYEGSDVRAHSFRVEIPKAGSYVVELRSLFFDTYVVIRNAEGKVIAEDDDGLYWTHSQLHLPSLEEEGRYRVDACALRDGFGSFEILLREGAPEPITEQIKAAELADAHESLRVAENDLGPNHPRTAAVLGGLGRIHFRRGDYGNARALLERALRIREEIHGVPHHDTATSLNDLAMLLN